MSWTHFHDEQLIVEVQKNEVIFDRHHSSYHNLDARDSAWFNIGDAMQKNGKKLKFQLLIFFQR